MLRAFGATLSNSQKKGWKRGKQKFQVNGAKPSVPFELTVEQTVEAHTSLVESVLKTISTKDVS